MITSFWYSASSSCSRPRAHANCLPLGYEYRFSQSETQFDLETYSLSYGVFRSYAGGNFDIVNLHHTNIIAMRYMRVVSGTQDYSWRL